MKRHVLVATGLAVLSTSAFATKARMEALNQDSQRGSFYVQDNRRIFMNPATLVNTGKMVTTEWGTAKNTADSDAAPNAEGGFYNEAAGFSYGLHLGSDIDAKTHNATRTTTNYLQSENNIDLFFAGDAGIQWGARVNFANGKDEQTTSANNIERKNTAFGLGFGIVMGDLQAFADLDISNKSKGSTTNGSHEFKNNFGFTVGANYTWNDMTFMGEYFSSGYERKEGTTTEVDMMDLKLGAGKVHEVATNARIFTDVVFNYNKEETKTTGTAETTSYRLPITIGFEADATSWLVLRGSVKQNFLIGQSETKAATAGARKLKATDVNTTLVAAGGTLNFGNLKVDGTIGRAVNSGATQTGTLRTDELSYRTAVTYSF
jgi:hypothetical protein